MGGKKKLTITQMEKRQQVLQRRQQEREREKRQMVQETTKEKIDIVSEELVQRIAKEILTWRCITPYEVATKFDLKISTAKKILRQLHERGLLYLVDKGRRVDIYVPAEKAPELLGPYYSGSSGKRS